jgi:hypothetical protein
MITDAERAVLARAWKEAEDSSASPRVQAMVEAERARIDKAFTALRRKIDVQFVDHDPYSSYEQMRDAVRSSKQMLIFKGGSETPLWDQETNWKARAVHDWDHITHDVDFSMEGETAAFRKSADRLPGLAPLYLSEIVLQAAVQSITGNFDEQKLVLPSDAVVKLVNSLRGDDEGVTAQQAAMLVWSAAGWLDFMRASDLMVHLRALGLDLDAALIVVDAAGMLHGRRL